MKTIEEFIKQIVGSADLQNELNAIKDKDSMEALLKKYEVNATVSEFVKALKAVDEGEISDGDAEAAAGGGIGSSFKHLIRGEFKDAWTSFIE